MKKIALIFVSLLFQIGLQAQTVEFEIIQDNKVVQPESNVYHLANKAFTIKITSHSIEGFLIGSTFTENVYESALGLADVDVEWFENTGMGEELFNPDKEIFVSDVAPSYWYFTDKNDHRFDKNPIGNADNWVGKRTIAGFYLIEESRKISVKNNSSTLYLYAYTPVYDEEYNLVDRNLLFNKEIKFSN